jgi:hypothetical protein
MTAAVVGPAAHGGVARHVAGYCSGMEKETAGRHVPPSADGDVDITVDPEQLAATPADPDSRPATADPEQTDGDDLGGTAGGNAGGAG